MTSLRITIDGYELKEIETRWVRRAVDALSLNLALCDFDGDLTQWVQSQRVIAEIRLRMTLEHKTYSS